jgi:hypothetical protein
MNEKDALVSIIAEIEPVLSFVSHKIMAGEYYDGEGLGVSQIEYLPLRGMIVVDNFNEEHCDQNDIHGKYKGSRLILTDCGEFVDQMREGKWSRSLGSEWHSRTEDIMEEAALTKYGFMQIVLGIIRSLGDAVRK